MDKQWAKKVKGIITKSAALVVLLGLAPSIAIGQTCKYETIKATTPDSRFVDNGNGTISDSGTGLMWMKCSLGQNRNDCSDDPTPYNWKSALEAAEAITFAGYSDWRLPNIDELSSIVEQACYDTAINTSYFPNTISGIYWSGSPDAHGYSSAWDVDFFLGYAYYYSKGSSLYVRLVRSQ